MRIRPRRQPVLPRHVIAMLAVLAVVTWLMSALVVDVSQQGFLDSIEPIATCLLVAATFFVPALRRACTNRGSWSALRRAQRYLRDFGLCLGLLGTLGLALMFSEFRPASSSDGLPDIVFDLSVDAMLDGSTIYLWGWVAMLILRGVMWIESKLARGAR
ncbi:hypothetical protein [Burkholderia gladioli]|uniref:hypothetical protein n=1 Tax=Burkholderia gladioli TaxID=28095 RepID=UPI0016403BBE|nr:hypothetical protein [Burkholderia gladioli]